MEIKENNAKQFKSCSFCPTEKLETELYKCPKCQRLYCSLRCYRNKRHLECSENFYRQQCEEHVGEPSAGSSSSENNIKRPTTTFEQYMEQNQNGKDDELLDEERVNPKLPVEVNADEQILFDSDDEPEYLGNIVESTMQHFEAMDEGEVDRKLLAAGLPIGVDRDTGREDQEQLEQLYQQLNDEEKRAFTSMAEGLFENEFQAYTNCFKPKKGKKKK